jgi:hypothetical protein
MGAEYTGFSYSTVASAPKAAEELREPLLLAVRFGFRLDCLHAPLVPSALRAPISPRPDAAPRALTAGLFFSRTFFNRLDWHSHSRPPRFDSPIVALISSQINPVLCGLGEGRGSGNPSDGVQGQITARSHAGAQA